MLSQSKVVDFNAILLTQLVAEFSVEKQSRKWKCHLPETFVGEYLIIPLTSAKMLKTESNIMNNRYRDYIGQCMESRYCLFSIRSRVGEHLATLGLVADEGYWRFDQCKGPSNTEVLEETQQYLDEDGELQEEWCATELYYVAQDVARLMNSNTYSH